jgi:hypothetical protein
MLRVTNADFICLRNVSDPVSPTDSELLYHTLDPSGVFVSWYTHCWHAHRSGSGSIYLITCSWHDCDPVCCTACTESLSSHTATLHVDCGTFKFSLEYLSRFSVMSPDRGDDSEEGFVSQ